MVFRTELVAVLGFAALWSSLTVAANAQEIAAPEPTAAHKLLQGDVGKWDLEIKIWGSGPDAPPMEGKGEEENRLLGGLWLVSEFRGQIGTVELVGHGQFGYDSQKGKYVGTWIDGMNPNMAEMVGEYDAEKKQFVYESTSRGPNGEEMKSTNIDRRVDDDHRVFEMLVAGPGGEKFKMIEIKYTRKK